MHEFDPTRGRTMPAQAPEISALKHAAMSALSATSNNLPNADSDEAALMHILRLLNRVMGPASLTPVERAFIAGAKVMFTDLSRACDQLLQRDHPLAQAETSDPTVKPKAIGKR